jgi:tetratricopeptide (TPR) repeat protein
MGKELATVHSVVLAELNRVHRLDGEGSFTRELETSLDALIDESDEDLATRYREALGLVEDFYAGTPEAGMKVLASMDRLATDYPFFALAPYWMARILEDAGRMVQPVELYDEALSREPDFAEALVRRASFHIRALEWEAAETKIARALELKPGLAEVHFLHARIQQRKGDGTAAMESARIAEKLAPHDLQLRGQAQGLCNVVRGPVWAKTFEATTKNYLIRTDLSEDAAKQFASEMEAMRPVYQQVTGLTPKLDEPAEILIFNTQEGYFSYVEFISGERHEQMIGMFNPLYDQMMLFDHPETDRTRGVLYHEGFHQYLNGVMPHAPIWYHEGMAEYVGGTRIRNGAVVKRGMIQEARLRDLHTAMRMGWRPRGFEEIMTATRQVFYSQDPAFQYAQAWSMVHFFMHGADRKWKPALQAYTRTLAGGATAEEAWAQTFGQESVYEMEQGWLEYVRSLAP